MLGIDVKAYGGLGRERLLEMLAAVETVRAALVGDLCLDAYWRADMTKSELSRETPHFPLPVVEERYSPGAGGNAAANLAALRPRSLAVLGVTGADWRADLLIRELEKRDIDASRVVRRAGRVTNAYIKPVRRGLSHVEYEDPRLDFANTAPQPAEVDAALIAALDGLAGDIDVLCVSDQFELGCVTDAVRAKINRLAAGGLPVVVDSRYRIGLFSGCILKPNELEARAAAPEATHGGEGTLEGDAAVAAALARVSRSRVCMTLGRRGCLIAGEGAAVHVGAVEVPPPVDICGAGDTFLASLSCSIAAGATIQEAAAMAALASAVTVKKLGETGTASAGEIMETYDGKRAP